MDFLMFETKIGTMAAGEEDGQLVRIWLPDLPLPRIASHETPLLNRTREQLEEYLDSKRREFDLPLAPQGTPFQRKVWDALRSIPWGETRTYADLAKEVGSPKGFRAVGMACNRNPIPIVIPCHRVVGKGGNPVGYAGGVDLKLQLLRLEGVLL